MRTFVLDGDNVRQGLNKDLGFTPADRAENVRRVAEMAKLMMGAGVVVLVALVSPFRSDRRAARDLFDAGDFVEVYVKTPVEVCEPRDPKGLYAKAAAGDLPNLTGVGQDYEEPLVAGGRRRRRRSGRSGDRGGRDPGAGGHRATVHRLRRPAGRAGGRGDLTEPGVSGSEVARLAT